MSNYKQQHLINVLEHLMHLCKGKKRQEFQKILFLFYVFSVLQPEPTLPERYQLARAGLHWYCSAKAVRTLSF